MQEQNQQYHTGTQKLIERLELGESVDLKKWDRNAAYIAAQRLGYTIQTRVIPMSDTLVVWRVD